MDNVVQYESQWRLAVFVLVFLGMAFWEIVNPRRRQEIPRLFRWSNNLALVVLDTLVLRLFFPVMAVGFASIVQHNQWGLFNITGLPVWLAAVLSFVLLDLVIYTQHVMFHRVPVLWRLHRMHHADLDYDVTTGIRFHPIEIVLSMLLKMLVVGLLGAPAIAVMLFEIALNATALFSHGNVSLPKNLDRVVRWFVVTPDMHRVHHSSIPSEFNRNFGFNLPWWDRLFRTYKDQPAAGHDNMEIGLRQFRDPRELRLDKLLVQPFK